MSPMYCPRNCLQTCKTKALNSQVSIVTAVCRVANFLIRTISELEAEIEGKESSIDSLLRILPTSRGGRSSFHRGVMDSRDSGSSTELTSSYDDGGFQTPHRLPKQAGRRAPLAAAGAGSSISQLFNETA
jgi:hypothetical protein